MNQQLHGWVTPRPDGAKAKCGGPMICRHCQAEMANMTTNTTNSQAASIDTPEFRIRLSAVSWESRSAPSEAFEDVMNRLIAYIDAKLAQVEREAYSKGADDVQAHAEVIINRTVERAKKTESRLAEIQRGVEGLPILRSGSFAGEYIGKHEVLALLQPQGQADTSGLPG